MREFYLLDESNKTFGKVNLNQVFRVKDEYFLKVFDNATGLYRALVIKSSINTVGAIVSFRSGDKVDRIFNATKISFE